MTHGLKIATDLRNPFYSTPRRANISSERETLPILLEDQYEVLLPAFVSSASVSIPHDLGYEPLFEVWEYRMEIPDRTEQFDPENVATIVSSPNPFGPMQARSTEDELIIDIIFFDTASVNQYFFGKYFIFEKRMFPE